MKDLDDLAVELLGRGYDVKILQVDDDRTGRMSLRNLTRHRSESEKSGERMKKEPKVLIVEKTSRISQIAMTSFQLESGYRGETLVALTDDGRLFWRVYTNGAWQGWEKMDSPVGEPP